MRSKASSGRGSCLTRLSGPGAGACEAKLAAVADHAIFRLTSSGAGACEAKLAAVADNSAKDLSGSWGFLRRSSLEAPQPPVLFIAGLHRRQVSWRVMADILTAIFHIIT